MHYKIGIGVLALAGSVLSSSAALAALVLLVGFLMPPVLARGDHGRGARRRVRPTTEAVLHRL